MLSGQSASFTGIPPQYELERVKLNNSANSLFNDIAADKEGYLWLAGTGGLDVFDGHNTITYRNGSKAYPISTSSSGTNVIGQMVTDPEGRFWIVDGQHVFHFDPLTRSVRESFVTGETAPAFFRFSPQSSAILYYAASQAKENSVCLYQRKPGLPSERIFKIPYFPGDQFYYTATKIHHWFFRNNNLYRVSPDGKETKQYPTPEKPSFIIHATDSNLFFSGIKQHAIFWWNPATDRIERYISLPGNITGTIQVIHIEANLVYIASNLNLFILDRAAHTIQDLSPQFSALVQKETPGQLSEPLIRVYRPGNGGLLLETQSNLYRLKKKMPPASHFLEKVITDQSASYAKPVSFRAITEDEQGNVYASYYSNISRKPAGAEIFIPFDVKRYMKGDLVSTYSLQYWNKHLLWNNVKIHITTGQHRYLFDSAFSGHCTQYLVHDTCWLYRWGTRSLHCYDLTHDQLTSYPLDHGVSGDPSITTLIDMNDLVSGTGGDELWFSSHDFGLCLIDKKGKLLKQYRRKELGTSDDYITDLERTGNELWFGCTDGLGVLNITTGKVSLFKNPVIVNGQLKNRAVFSISPDANGNFYLGSSNGLLYFNTQTKTFFNLPEGHPLAAPEFNRASVFKTRNGHYYFGTTNGLYSFTGGEPGFSEVSGPVKPPKLTGVSVFSSRSSDYRYLSRNLDSLRTLVLQPFDNSVQLSFSVPAFHQDIYYSYRIKGFMDNWTEYKPENKITITGLRPGYYTLEVKVSTALSDANAVHYVLELHVKQLWYKNVWVIVLFVMALLTLVILFVRSRFNQRLKRQQELAALRTRISSDLHDDVGTLLSGLAMQSQMLAYTAGGEQKKSLDEISAMSREAMEHMRDTVWAMDSRKDKYENLIDRMRAFAEKNLAMKNLTHEFIISDVDTRKFIDPEKRQAIYLIFKEAITNIIKHSDGTHVTIRFGNEKKGISLTIHDNGNANTASASDGLGLSNMKMRAEKIGGTFTTQYKDGFEVLLVVP